MLIINDVYVGCQNRKYIYIFISQNITYLLFMLLLHHVVLYNFQQNRRPMILNQFHDPNINQLNSFFFSKTVFIQFKNDITTFSNMWIFRSNYSIPTSSTPIKRLSSNLKCYKVLRIDLMRCHILIRSYTLKFHCSQC